MHAADINWGAVWTRIDEIVAEAAPPPESAAVCSVECLFVTGSLAYGGGEAHSSDLDLVVGTSAAQMSKQQWQMQNHLRNNEDKICAAVTLPISAVHIVDVTERHRAPHRAMELQHRGEQLARQHGVDDAPKLEIYDVQQRRVLSNARNGQTTRG